MANPHGVPQGSQTTGNGSNVPAGVVSKSSTLAPQQTPKLPPMKC